METQPKFYVYTFKYYDTLKHKWGKSNGTSWRDLEKYRQMMSKNDRYCYIGEIYERDIANPFSY